MTKLIPLELSHENGQLEHELKNLFISLFEAHIAPRMADVNVYGCPYLGTEQLIRRYLAVNRINAIVDEKIAAKNVDKLRYLLQAVIAQNPKRGLSFLKTFIKCLWGSEFDIYQLWQYKNAPYPEMLYEYDEIARDGYSEDDFFLTSRLRIRLRGNGADFPETLPKLIQGIIPARLMIHEVLRRFELETTLQMFSSASVYSFLMGEAIEIMNTEPKDVTAKATAFTGIQNFSIVTNKE